MSPALAELITLLAEVAVEDFLSKVEHDEADEPEPDDSEDTAT